MAEYIDRTQLEPDTEWDEYEDGFVSYSQAQIARMEPVDVIERFKFNKAIKKIERIEQILEEMDPLNTIIRIREVLDED